VATAEHFISSLAVPIPISNRLFINRTDLPLFERIISSIGQPSFLFALTDVEVILQKRDAGANEHILKIQNGMKKLLSLSISAKLHDPLDAGAVVPTAVEQH